MQLQTILNHVQWHKSFVYDRVCWADPAAKSVLEVHLRARSNGQPICSSCGRPGSGYDRLPTRRFEFVPLWGIAVQFVYAMRRVDCRLCGVTVEQVPRCDGKNQRLNDRLRFETNRKLATSPCHESCNWK